VTNSRPEKRPPANSKPTPPPAAPINHYSHAGFNHKERRERKEKQEGVSAGWRGYTWSLGDDHLSHNNFFVIFAFFAVIHR
jgi:hypothetical protein